MEQLAPLIDLASRHAGTATTAVPHLTITTRDSPTEIGAMIYDPMVCLVLSGAKRVFIGEQRFEYGAGHCLVVGAEVAALAQIAQASPEQPYLALNLYLDQAALAALLLDMSGMPEPPMPSGYGLSEAGPALIDAWRRLADLLDHPQEIQVMAHHREQELLFRLLMGPQGGLLREIGSSDSRLEHIRRAMRWIRAHHSEHLSVEAMATVAGMSVSVFHRRFKAVAGVSPLQYQKQIRLHEARRLLVTDRAEAATVAYTVGYESASQFSREYKRLFGRPPRRDTQDVQTLADPGA